jgi:hypothetical protein
VTMLMVLPRYLRVEVQKWRPASCYEDRVQMLAILWYQCGRVIGIAVTE